MVHQVLDRTIHLAAVRLEGERELGKVLMARGATNQKGPERAFLNAVETILKTRGRLPVNLMVVAEGEVAVDALGLFSYPVHPPGKPERSRTDHLPEIAVPTVFTHGTSDPFGTLAEVRAAAALIPAPTEIVEISGARHDLGSKTHDVAALAVDGALRLLGRPGCQTA